MAVQTFRELLRRRPFQPFRLVIFPFVALVLLSVACEGDHARNSVADHAPPANENTAPLPKSWEEMRTVVNQLPDADGRALVLYVKGKFAINFRETVAHNIPKGGSDQLWALKVFSRGQVHLSEIADLVEWPDMGNYFRTEALDAAALIRGDITSDEYVARTKANESNAARLLAAEERRIPEYEVLFNKHVKLFDHISGRIISEAKLFAAGDGAPD